MCIDWSKAGIDLSSASHSSLEIMAVPCNLRESAIITDAVDNIRNDCILDQ